MCDACKSRTVLVLDDDPLQLQLLDLMLRAEGVVAECFDQPDLALLRAAGCAGPLSLLMDLNLPDHDPADFCRQLRAACSGSQLRLVAMSATVPAPSLSGIFDAFLLKPIDGRQLAEAACPQHDSPHSVPLNDSTFVSLAQHMTPAQLDSLFTTYFADTSNRFAALDAAIDQGDVTACLHAAHAIKGSSAMLGIQSVAATMGRMESLVDCGSLTPQLPQAVALLASARRSNEQARLLLAPRLRQLAAASPVSTYPVASFPTRASVAPIGSIQSVKTIRPIASSTAEDQRAKTP